MLPATGFSLLLDLGKLSTSIHSTGFSSLIRAIFKTSSTVFTVVILISFNIFSGISTKSFDKSGNYNLGVQDHLIFPEIDPTKSSKVKGMNITIVTTSINDDHSKVLMEQLGFPFKR